MELYDGGSGSKVLYVRGVVRSTDLKGLEQVAEVCRVKRKTFFQFRLERLLKQKTWRKKESHILYHCKMSRLVSTSEQF